MATSIGAPDEDPEGNLINGGLVADIRLSRCPSQGVRIFDGCPGGGDMAGGRPGGGDMAGG